MINWPQSTYILGGICHHYLHYHSNKYLFHFQQNISGVFTAVISILALLLAPNIRTSAIYYFITAIFVLLACFDTYFALPLNVRVLVLVNNFTNTSMYIMLVNHEIIFSFVCIVILILILCHLEPKTFSSQWLLLSDWNIFSIFVLYLIFNRVRYHFHWTWQFKSFLVSH